MTQKRNLSGFYNIDCMLGLAEVPDGYFDLAIVDPPYGIGYDMAAAKKGGTKYGNAKAAKTIYPNASTWDASRPNKEYFKELLRVSKQQIIWGGNYYSDMLPPSKGFICWDKRREGSVNNFADCELAWLSQGLGVARMFRFYWNGMITEELHKEKRIHPTQKPIELYKWCLLHYAKPGYRILDTHVGSGSSLIACEEMGFDYLGFEIDPEYYKLAKERIAEHLAQLRWQM